MSLDTPANCGPSLPYTPVWRAGLEISKFDDARGSARASRLPDALAELWLMCNVARVGDSFLSSRMVAFMSSKSESKTEIAAVPGQVQRLTVFCPPLLLEGEDAGAYDELLGRICAAVKPVDVIDEMLIADIVALEWEVLRWRRLKRTSMREPVLKALKLFFDRTTRVELRSPQGTLSELSQGNSRGQPSARASGLCGDAGGQMYPEQRGRRRDARQGPRQHRARQQQGHGRCAGR